jgi:hypothetical protein
MHITKKRFTTYGFPSAMLQRPQQTRNQPPLGILENKLRAFEKKSAATPFETSGSDR